MSADNTISVIRKTSADADAKAAGEGQKNTFAFDFEGVTEEALRGFAVSTLVIRQQTKMRKNLKAYPTQTPIEINVAATIATGRLTEKVTVGSVKAQMAVLPEADRKALIEALMSANEEKVEEEAKEEEAPTEE